MTSRFELRDIADGTELIATHEGLPEGVSARDNEMGWNMALEKLCRLLERA